MNEILIKLIIKKSLNHLKKANTNDNFYKCTEPKKLTSMKYLLKL